MISAANKHITICKILTNLGDNNLQNECKNMLCKVKFDKNIKDLGHIELKKSEQYQYPWEGPYCPLLPIT